MTAISVTDYVLSVISDSKYGGDIEWVKANLDPRHVRRIEAEYTRQQREEAWDQGTAEAHNNHLSYEEVQMLNPYRPETPPFNIHKWADEVRKAND